MEARPLDESKIKVADTGDIPEGEARVFNVENISIAICNVGGTYYAIENVCTHDNGPLGEGRLIGTQIECPRHGARFDVTSGEVKKQPAYSPVPTFPVQIDNGAIFIDITNY